jgi:ABC-type lipoprotein export system ATPase subunit
MLEMVGLGSRLDHHPGQLSGGQQQRVAIARALVTNPSILMGDEPTGNLDSRTSREVIELFKQLNEQQKITVILVTHDLNVARNARRILVLRDGSIVADTTNFEIAFQTLQAAHSAPPEEAEETLPTA